MAQAGTKEAFLASRDSKGQGGALLLERVEMAVPLTHRVMRRVLLVGLGHAEAAPGQ
jgi:hypothetical protein